MAKLASCCLARSWTCSYTCYMMKAETKEGAPVTKYRPTRSDVALVQVTMEKGWFKTGILFYRLPWQLQFTRRWPEY